MPSHFYCSYISCIVNFDNIFASGASSMGLSFKPKQPSDNMFMSTYVGCQGSYLDPQEFASQRDIWGSDGRPGNAAVGSEFKSSGME